MSDTHRLQDLLKKYRERKKLVVVSTPPNPNTKPKPIGVCGICGSPNHSNMNCPAWSQNNPNAPIKQLRPMVQVGLEKLSIDIDVHSDTRLEIMARIFGQFHFPNTDLHKVGADIGEVLTNYFNGVPFTHPRSPEDERAEGMLNLLQYADKLMDKGDLAKSKTYIFLVASIKDDARRSKRFREIEDMLIMLDDKMERADENARAKRVS